MPRAHASSCRAHGTDRHARYADVATRERRDAPFTLRLPMSRADRLPRDSVPTRSLGAVLVVTSILLVALVVVALASGRYPLSPVEVGAAVRDRLTGQVTTTTADAVVWQIRAPRVAVALVVGAALSVAGAAFQHIFRNPLVAPDTLGVSSGAALGAVIAIFAGASALAIETSAFAGGLVAAGSVMLIASRLRAHEPIVTLILTGIVVAGLLGAILSMLKFLADPWNQLPAITFWLMGSFSAVTFAELMRVLPVVAVAVVALASLAWRINLLALPDDDARALGVDTRVLRGVVIVVATLMTAACVAVSGVVGWVGLIVPHMARLIVGPDFSRLLPTAALLGAAFMLAMDTLARSLAAVEIPPGILTAFVGTPVFIALLARTATR